VSSERIWGIIDERLHQMRLTMLHKHLWAYRHCCDMWQVSFRRGTRRTLGELNPKFVQAFGGDEEALAEFAAMFNRESRREAVKKTRDLLVARSMAPEGARYLFMLPRLTILDVRRGFGGVGLHRGVLQVEIAGIYTEITHTPKSLQCPVCGKTTRSLVVRENGSIQCAADARADGFGNLPSRFGKVAFSPPKPQLGSRLSKAARRAVLNYRRRKFGWLAIQKRMKKRFRHDWTVGEIAFSIGDRCASNKTGTSKVNELHTYPCRVCLGTDYGLAGEVWVNVPRVRLFGDARIRTVARTLGFNGDFQLNPLRPTHKEKRMTRTGVNFYAKKPTARSYHDCKLRGLSRLADKNRRRVAA